MPLKANAFLVMQVPSTLAFLMLLRRPAQFSAVFFPSVDTLELDFED